MIEGFSDLKPPITAAHFANEILPKGNLLGLKAFAQLGGDHGSVATRVRNKHAGACWSICNRIVDPTSQSDRATSAVLIAM